MPRKDNIFELLKNDHREVEQMLRDLIGNEREMDGAKVRKMCDSLEVHMRIEEDYLYPKAEQEDEAARLIKDGYQEHKQVKDLMEQLRRGENTMEVSRYGQILREIQNGIRHHVREEENQLFPMLQKAWDEDTIDRLGERMMERRQELMSGQR